MTRDSLHKMLRKKIESTGDMGLQVARGSRDDSVRAEQRFTLLVSAALRVEYLLHRSCASATTVARWRRFLEARRERPRE
jgi:hypothetical protein